MLLRKDHVVLQVELIGEQFVAFPNSVDILNVVFADGLVKINLSKCFGLRSLVAADGDTGMLSKLNFLILLGVGDLQTKTSMEVFERIDVFVIERFGIVADTVRILVNTGGDLEGVRGLDTVGAMHAVNLICDPDARRTKC